MTGHGLGCQGDCVACQTRRRLDYAQRTAQLGALGAAIEGDRQTVGFAVSMLTPAARLALLDGLGLLRGILLGHYEEVRNERFRN
jgi:hypothetical protein